MKRFLALLLTLLCLASLLCACGREEKEETIVGVWKSEELSDSSISQRMVYAFEENGHMLSIDLYADAITRVIGAHYALDEEGILTVRQFGKEDGEMIADLSGDTLTLSLNLSSGDFGEGEEDLSQKSIRNCLRPLGSHLPRIPGLLRVTCFEVIGHQICVLQKSNLSSFVILVSIVCRIETTVFPLHIGKTTTG